MINNLNIKEWMGVAAGVLSLIAYFPYIFSILKYKTKPSRSSWWIWSFVGLIILLSYYSIGARSTIWVPVVFFLGPLIVAILSLRFGEGERLNQLDKICILGTFAGLIPWIIFQSAKITLLVEIFIDFLGFLPTMQKTFLHPLYENKISWILFFFASILNLIAIETFSLSIVSYPLYMFIMDVIMLLLLYRKR